MPEPGRALAAGLFSSPDFIGSRWESMSMLQAALREVLAGARRGTALGSGATAAALRRGS